jgi:hypothetical protein
MMKPSGLWRGLGRDRNDGDDIVNEEAEDTSASWAFQLVQVDESKNFVFILIIDRATGSACGFVISFLANRL